MSIRRREKVSFKHENNMRNDWIQTDRRESKFNPLIYFDTDMQILYVKITAEIWRINQWEIQLFFDKLGS